MVGLCVLHQTIEGIMKTLKVAYNECIWYFKVHKDCEDARQHKMLGNIWSPNITQVQVQN